MTVTAVVVCHEDKKQLLNMIRQLKEQTQPPEQIIAIACCTDIDDLGVDIALPDEHQGDWGHKGRETGLKHATEDRIGFFNCDDEYEPDFIEKLCAHGEDLVFCDFKTHAIGGRVIESHPSLGAITSGNFLVNRKLAQEVGWNHRDYLGDGKFILDITATGCTWLRIPEVLYLHN